jgi:hypothetical protein
MYSRTLVARTQKDWQNMFELSEVWATKVLYIQREKDSVLFFIVMFILNGFTEITKLNKNDHSI